MNSEPSDRLRIDWPGGHFEAASRAFTDTVEGEILSNRHLVMVTLSGGATRHQFRTEDGSRHECSDRVGSASFLPAGCRRELRLEKVAWRWGAIALEPDTSPDLAASRSFAVDDDPFLYGLVSQMHHLAACDGTLDATYCGAMSQALSAYLTRRPTSDSAPVGPLSRRQLRQITDFIEGNLDRPIHIQDLAALTGYSDGHFHRAFRAATGETPLTFVNRQRVLHATRRMSENDASILDICLACGFSSPGYFARLFRRVHGVSPSDYRQRLRGSEKV